MRTVRERTGGIGAGGGMAPSEGVAAAKAGMACLAALRHDQRMIGT